MLLPQQLVMSDKPRIGDTVKAPALGFTGRATYEYTSCPGCGLPRWVVKDSVGTLCRPCAAQNRARRTAPVTYSGGRDPVIGDIATAGTLGRTGRGRLFFVACPSCGRPRWTRSQGAKATCPSCVDRRRGSEHPRWTESRSSKRGYTFVKVAADHPFRSMADKNGWVLEHRLVAATTLGRPLTRDDVVHHRNGAKNDNRPDNLKVLTSSTHNSHMVSLDQQERIRALEQRVTQLEASLVTLACLVSVNRDGTPHDNENIQYHNTLGTLLNKQGEGIVHPLSNETDSNGSV